jgi:hypothetical protein
VAVSYLKNHGIKDVSFISKGEIPVFHSSLRKGRSGAPSVALCSAAFLLLSIGSIGNSAPAQAQQQGQQQGQQQASELVAAAPDRLKDKVSLPNVPEYTGKAKYLHGLVYSHINNQKQGPAYVMCFNAKESIPQVRDWWLASLRQYRWNITYTSKDVVQGSDKDGSTCIIQIGPPVAGVAKDDKASFEIRFQAAK